MAKNTLESPKICQKITPKPKKNYLKLKNDEKLPKNYLQSLYFVTSSPSSGFIYLRE
jgi:hypothetical protein